MEFDYGGDDAFRGIGLRAGVGLGAMVELAVGAEHWPDLRPYDGGWSVQAEGSMYPLGRRRVAPYLLLHLGHFWATLPSGSIYTRRGLSGRTTGLALGFHGRVLDPLGVRVEGVLRFDAGGGNDQLRGFITYTPGVQHLPVPSAQMAVVVYGMVRMSGPWQNFVEPAYALKFTTGLSERDAAALTIALLHWQIPGRRQFASYLWDTRAALLMLGWQRGRRSGNVRWYVQAGPAMSVMMEGPDWGLRGGAHAEFGGSVRAGSLPGLAVGLGGVWIVRSASDAAVPPTDQRGLLVHAGVAF
jgi:hypothetical protein